MIAKTGLLWALTLAVLSLAGAGSAAASEFHSSEAEAALTGSASEAPVPLVLNVQGQTAECGSGSFAGTGAESTFASLALAPVYSNCEALGFTSATVTTTGCELTYDAEGGLDLEGCSAGPSEEAITISTSPGGFGECQVEIPNQSGLNGVSYENQPGNSALLVETASSNVNFAVVKSTGFCPLSEGEGSNAVLTQAIDLEANEGGAELWVE